MLDEVKEGVLYMKTHELEKELGISKHTIFYYEKEGIITPQRDDNGYRSYSQDDLQKLIMVKFLRPRKSIFKRPNSSRYSIE